MTEIAHKLWVTDDELIKASGVPVAEMRVALQKLDSERLSGFPRKNPLYGNRRYFPAVLEYWRVTNPVPQPRGSPQEMRKSA